MIKVYQITFSEEERNLLNKCMDVVATFMLALHGDMGDIKDALVVKQVLDNPQGVEDLVRKINRDLDIPHFSA